MSTVEIDTETGPRRIQRKRTKGWRAPEGAVYVGRGTRWGNPFKIGGGYVTRGVIDVPAPLTGPYKEGTYYTRDVMGKKVTYEARTVADGAEAVELFKRYISNNWWYDQATVSRELGGRDLMCWCPLSSPCHADVLLELAASPLAQAREGTA